MKNKKENIFEKMSEIKISFIKQFAGVPLYLQLQNQETSNNGYHVL